MTCENEISLEQNELFNIYPNPSAGLFTITLNEINSDGELNIINSQGKLIITETISKFSKSKLLNLTDHPKGLYFIQFYSNGKQEIKKIIIK